MSSPAPAASTEADTSLKKKAMEASEEDSEEIMDPKKKEEAEVDDAVPNDQDDEEILSLRKSAYIFHHMALHPYWYMLVWPILFAFLIGFGWTQEGM